MSAIPHGTAGGYVNHGCRCDECRAAFAADMKRQRRRRAERLAGVRPKPLRSDAKSAPEHGKRSTYDWLCRCSACTAAWAEYRRRRTA